MATLPLTLKVPKIKVPFAGILITSIVFNIAAIVGLLYIQKNIPPFVPLWYGGPSGEGQLAPRLFIVSPNAIALSVVITNVFFIKITKDQFLQKVLIGLTLTATILASITVLNIVLLVGKI